MADGQVFLSIMLFWLNFLRMESCLVCPLLAQSIAWQLSSLPTPGADLGGCFGCWSDGRQHMVGWLSPPLSTETGGNYSASFLEFPLVPGSIYVPELNTLKETRIYVGLTWTRALTLRHSSHQQQEKSNNCRNRSRRRPCHDWYHGPYSRAALRPATHHNNTRATSSEL